MCCRSLLQFVAVCWVCYSMCCRTWITDPYATFLIHHSYIYDMTHTRVTRLIHTWQQRATANRSGRQRPDTHTHTHTYTHTHTHTHTHTYTHTHTHTQTHTNTHTHTQTHTHTYGSSVLLQINLGDSATKGIGPLTDKPIHIYVCIHVQDSYTCDVTYTRVISKHTYTHTQTHTHKHTNTHTYKHTCTHTHTSMTAIEIHTIGDHPWSSFWFSNKQHYLSRDTHRKFFFFLI